MDGTNVNEFTIPQSILLHFYDIDDNELPKLSESFDASEQLHVIFTHINMNQSALTSNNSNVNASNLTIKLRSNPTKITSQNSNTALEFNQNSSLTLIQAIEKCIDPDSDPSNITSFDFIISINPIKTNIITDTNSVSNIPSASNPNPIPIPITNSNTNINNYSSDDDNHTLYTVNSDTETNPLKMFILPNNNTNPNFISNLTPIPEANGTNFDILTQQIQDIAIDTATNDLPPDVSAHHAQIDDIDVDMDTNTNINISTSTILTSPIPLPLETDALTVTHDPNHNHPLNLPSLNTEFEENQDDGDRDILSRQYVHTVHQLMGKDIIIPAPAIPNNMDIMEKSEFEDKFSVDSDEEEEGIVNQIGLRVNFGEEGKKENGEDNTNENENGNQQSYYHKICEMNKEENNSYHQFLGIYPKRILSKDHENCNVWTNLSVRSLSTHLQNKKVKFFF